jgi:hypothetical protein
MLQGRGEEHSFKILLILTDPENPDSDKKLLRDKGRIY